MKTNKKSKSYYLIVVLVVFLLALAVGYAAFNNTLHITGTANAKGTFDMQFKSATVNATVGVDTTATKAVISADKDTVTVTVKDLAYPGAGAQFTVVIENVGTIPAKVNSVTPTGITGSSHIKISGLDAITTAHPTIAAGGTCTLTFTVVWDASATTALTDAEKTGISFNLDIDYVQDTTTTFTGTPAHTDA